MGEIYFPYVTGRIPAPHHLDSGLYIGAYRLFLLIVAGAM